MSAIYVLCRTPLRFATLPIAQIPVYFSEMRQALLKYDKISRYLCRKIKACDFLSDLSEIGSLFGESVVRFCYVYVLESSPVILSITPLIQSFGYTLLTLFTPRMVL